MKVFKYLKTYLNRKEIFDFVIFYHKWIKHLDTSKKIRKFLWGDSSIEPFGHHINHNIWEHNKGLDGIKIFNQKFYQIDHYTQGCINVIKDCLHFVKNYSYSFHKNKLITIGSDSHALSDFYSNLPPKELDEIIHKELKLFGKENESNDEFFERIIIKPLLYKN